MLLFVDPNSGADAERAGSVEPDGGMRWPIIPPISSRCCRRGACVTIRPRSSATCELGLEVRTSMQSQPVRHIGILGLHRDELNQKDVVTSSLEVINMATAGYLAPRQGAKTAFEPLLAEFRQRRRSLPAERFNALTDPATLRDGFKPTGVRYALAARISGPLDSAYPQGAPADGKPPAGPPAAHLGEVRGAREHRHHRGHGHAHGLHVGADA